MSSADLSVHCNANIQRLTDRVLIMKCAGAADHGNSRKSPRLPVSPYLSETCGMVMTVDGSRDDRTTLEGYDKPFIFMDTKYFANGAGGRMTEGVEGG